MATDLRKHPGSASPRFLSVDYEVQRVMDREQEMERDFTLDGLEVGSGTRMGEGAGESSETPPPPPLSTDR